MLADVKIGCAPVRVLNLQLRSSHILSWAMLFWLTMFVVCCLFSDESQEKNDKEGSKEACLSFDPIVAGCGVDLSKAAVEDEHHGALLKELVEKNATPHRLWSHKNCAA